MAQSQNCRIGSARKNKRQRQRQLPTIPPDETTILSWSTSVASSAMTGQKSLTMGLAAFLAGKLAILYWFGSLIGSGFSMALFVVVAAVLNFWVANTAPISKGNILRVALIASAISFGDVWVASSTALDITTPKSLGLDGKLARPAQIVDASRHLRGQRTIRRKPHGTAQLLVDDATCVCVDAAHEASIVVRFSHTAPAWVTYGIKPLNDPAAKVIIVNETISHSQLAELTHPGRLPQAEDADEYALIRGRSPAARAPVPQTKSLNAERAPWRQRGQASGHAEDDEPDLLLRLPVPSAGRVRLLRAADALGREATINPSQSAELIVAKCPVAAWDAHEAKPLHACAGDDVELPLHVEGVGPLELGWSWAPFTEVDDVSAHSQPDQSARVERVLSHLSDKLSDEEALTKANVSDFDWARQQQVPLSLRFAPSPLASAPVQKAYQIRLDAIRDACGNVNPSPAIQATRAVLFHPRPHVLLAPAASQASAEVPLLAGSPRTLAKLDTSSRHKAEQQSTPAVAVTAPDADGPWKASLLFVSSLAKGERRYHVVEGSSANDVVRVTANEPGTWSVASTGSNFCAPRPPAPSDASTSAASSPGTAPVRVAVVPPPQVNITLRPISDACAGPVGVHAHASFLSGTPPYTLTYHVHGGGQDLERMWRADTREADITLDVPPQVLARRGRKGAGGEVQYAFRALRDKYYDFAALDGPKMTQTVHPPLLASLASSQMRYASTCLNDTLTARIGLSGSGPLTVTYSVSGPEQGSVIHTVEGLQPGLDVPLEVALPPLPQEGYADLARIETSSTFTLLSVKDARGCTAKVPAQRAAVNIRRRLAAPSAGFVPSTLPSDAEPGMTGSSRLAEGQETSLPLQLTGRAPWKLAYTKDDGPLTLHTVHVAPSGAAALDVDAPGVYKLHSVRDADCPGNVENVAWQVGSVPRPRVAFASSAGESPIKPEKPHGHLSFFGSKKLKKPSTGSPIRPVGLVRRPVCLRQPDDAPLSIVPGEAWPVQIVYEHQAQQPHTPWRSQEEGGAFKESTETNTFSAAQGTTLLPLDTSVPGTHTYTLTQVGDDVYPLSPLQGESDIVRLTQVVHPPPSAKFVVTEPVQACVGDTMPALRPDDVRIIARSEGGTSGSASLTATDVRLPLVELRGVPPFSLDLSLTSPNGSQMAHTIHIPEGSADAGEATTLIAHVSLASDLPLTVAGKWTAAITGVQDAACSAPSSSADGQEAVLDVHDTPTARPFADREMCVGSALTFGLTGQPRWDVTYLLTPAKAIGDYAPTDMAALAQAEATKGTVQKVQTDSAVFTRLASTPGRVRLVKVEHPGSPCAWTPPPGTEEQYSALIRDLPSVTVDQGAPDEQTLFEGATAMVRFSLQGATPFSFVYQRTEPVDLATRPKVLDTQTVSRVSGNEYSLSTSEEGMF